MGQYQIAVVVGSLRRDSFNRKLADALIKLAPPEFTFEHLNIGNEDSRKFLQNWMNRYVDWVKRHAA